MEQRSNDAAVMDAQNKLKREEYALGTEQKLFSENDAELKAAQINPTEEEYARDTVHTAILTKNLQLSHRVLDQNLIRLH